MTEYDAWIAELEKEHATMEANESALAEAQSHAYDNDLRALVTAAQNVIDSHHNLDFVSKLREVIENFLPWMDEEDANDPRANGWVDDKGRP